MNHVLDSWLGKTPVVKEATKLSTIKFVIQTITKASSITFGKSRNVHIISVVFIGVNKSSLLGNTTSGYIIKYRISNYTDTKGRKK